MMKRKNIIVLILAAVLGLTACVILTHTIGFTRLGTKAPRIVFDSEMIDFGEREEGEHAKCTFVFRNQGNATLILHALKASCKCLLAEPSRTVIKPGETSELVATYDTQGRNGRVKSTVRLATNDPKAEVVRLTITGGVRKAYVHHPRVIDFGEARAGLFPENTLVITRPTKRDMKVVHIETSKPWLMASLVSEDQRQQERLSFGEHRVAVKIASDAPVGPIKEEIVVSLLMKSSKTKRQIRIPVTGYVEGDLTYEPKTVFWGTIAQGQTKETTIIVKSNESKSVGIKSVRSMAEQVRVALIEESPMSASIRVELKDGLMTGFLRDTVIITTASEVMSQIEIPIRARLVGLVGEATVQHGKEVMPVR